MSKAIPLELAYPSVMLDFARRVTVAYNALVQVINHPNNEDSLVSCELAVLQLRKICELVLLGSTLAHLDHGEQIDDSKWHPKDAFAQLELINEHPLPFPVDVEIDKNGLGQHHIQPISKPVTSKSLYTVYGRCGDFLHIPSARRVLKGRRQTYDVESLMSWTSGFKRLLMGHALLLPNRHKAMACYWDGFPESRPVCLLLEAQGESTLDMSSFPDFSLFQ